MKYTALVLPSLLSQLSLPKAIAPVAPQLPHYHHRPKSLHHGFPSLQLTLLYSSHVG